ncbi:hypothetical protein [Niveispirillum fermenti]|uniref:hypothetical protein n=1 Tax=Niveispirillum fermenti TaxID=1233113 RepID=UPI003A874B0C
MISLTKLLTLIGILFVVWYGFRLLGRIQRQRQDALRRNGGGERPARKGTGRQEPADTQDMAKCTVCGVYVAAGAGKCGTPGCPR